MAYIAREAFFAAMEDLAPICLAEEWDNVGMLIDSGANEYRKVLVSLDLTPDVAEEAVRLGADLIVTHHPIFFSPLKRIDVRQMEGRTVSILLANRISHFAAHTNWDAAPLGVNFCLCEALNLKDHQSLERRLKRLKKLIVYAPVECGEKLRQALGDAGAGALGAYTHCSFSSTGEGRFLSGESSRPYIGKKSELTILPEVKIECIVSDDCLPGVLAAMREVHPYEEIAFDVLEEKIPGNWDNTIGLARMGNLENPMSVIDFCLEVKRKLGAPALRFTGDPQRMIQKISVSSGSGTSMMQQCMAAGADAMVTGDVKHNFALEAQAQDFVLIDAGHYQTEKPAMRALIHGLQERFHGLQYTTEFIESACECAPLQSL